MAHAGCGAADVRIPGERGYTYDEPVWRNEIMQTWGCVRPDHGIGDDDTQREVPPDASRAGGDGGGYGGADR